LSVSYFIALVLVRLYGLWENASSCPTNVPLTESMKATTYDKVSSMLIALLILGGAAVLLLFALWLSSQVFRRPLAVPVTLVPIGDGAGIDDGDAFDPNVTDPGGPSERDEQTLQEAFASVVNIVATNAAVFSDVSPFDDALLTSGGKRGDGRTKGEGVGKVGGRPRRWMFLFEKGITVPEYARLLDLSGIELGVIRSGGKVVCVSHLAAAKPTVREGATVDEKRYYLTWTKSDTDAADRELLEKAGVSNEGRPILKFLPSTLESELETMEREKAGSCANDIRMTSFGVKRQGNALKFLVLDQAFYTAFRH